MSVRTALPGLVTGFIGLLAGLIGLIADVPVFGAVAGVLALAAGIAGLRLAQRLVEHTAAQALIEGEVRALRAEAGAGSKDRDSKGSSSSAGSSSPAPATSTTGASTPSPAASSRSKMAPAVASAAAEAATGRGSAEEANETADAEADQSEQSDAAAQSSITIGGDDERNALVDKSTGLFSEEFFRVALESRIAAARRHLRPIAMVLIEVVEGLPGADPKPVAAKLVADTVKMTLREADTACRLRTGHFALLLEDTPENGAIWTVERIRRQLVEAEEGLTLWAGVACYPAHAFGPDEIVKAADQALVAAREWRQDRIEVAATAE